MRFMVDALELIEARDAAQTGRVRRLRVAAGLSQSDVARHVGVSAATVSRWESGKRAPVGESAVRLAHLLRELAQYVARPSQDLASDTPPGSRR